MGSGVLGHGCPQPMSVQAVDVHLRLLPGAGRDDGPPSMVHVEHELRRLLPGVAEELLEDVRHVGHEVDGIVPYDDDPGKLWFGDLVLVTAVDGLRLARRHGRHAHSLSSWNRCARTRTHEATCRKSAKTPRPTGLRQRAGRSCTATGACASASWTSSPGGGAAWSSWRGRPAGPPPTPILGWAGTG